MNRAAIFLIKKTMNKSWALIFRIFWAPLVFQKLSKKEIEILDLHFPYFQRLGPRHKLEFQRKIHLIFFTKKFIPRGGLKQVSLEMKILIAATIAQVTFGWSKVCLLHFDKILIYPDDYYSTIRKVFHRGEVNPKLGLIVFSWRSFIAGLTNQTDGINLGIHEVAHALKLQNLLTQSGESRFFDSKAWISYGEISKLEAERMKLNFNPLFRNSAFKDEHEFFAVALEVFFEKPSQFKQEVPLLYQVLVSLMRQDPTIWIIPPTS